MVLCAGLTRGACRCAVVQVWNRLGFFKSMKRKLPKNKRPVVGVLGCMAERLKTKLLESDRMVDLVAGPDAYRDLPDLIDVVRVCFLVRFTRIPCNLFV